MALAYTGTSYFGIMLSDATTGETALQFSELSAD